MLEVVAGYRLERDAITVQVRKTMFRSTKVTRVDLFS